MIHRGEPYIPNYSLFVSLIRLLIFHLASLRQAWFGNLQNKNPAAGCGSNLVCGERGIRTPGTLLRYTRFPGVPVKPLLHLSKIYAQGLKNRCANYKIFL